MDWNWRNVKVAAVFLILAFTLGGVMYVRSEGGLKFVMFRFEKWEDGLDGQTTPMTSDETKAVKRDAERLRKLIFTKCPDLRLQGKDVPADQNGYLALFDLAKDPSMAALRDSRPLDQSSKEKIDPSEIRNEFETFEELGKKIEHVAALPERSNVAQGRVHRELLPSTEVKAMNDYLLLQARLAALEGDEAESLRYLNLAANFTEHLIAIEGPNFLSTTVWILLRQGMYAMCFEALLPALGESADLEKWNSVLQPQTDVPQRLSQVQKGEFNYFSQNFSPHLFEEVPDPEQTAIAYSRWVEASVKHYEKMTFTQFAAAATPPNAPFTKEISREGVAMFEIMNLASMPWNRGFIRSVIVEHRYAAALDLLMREQKGEDLSRRTETFFPNPYTGKPFSYDPTARTLNPVSESEGADLEALKLPW